MEIACGDSRIKAKDTMTYEPKLPLCPYRANGNRHCSHKSCPDRCPYNKPERCDKYNEIVKNNKMDSKVVSDDLKAIGVLT